MCGKSLYHQSDRRDGQKNLNNNTRVNWISWSDPAPPADIIGRMTGNLPYWVAVAEVEGGDDLPKESSCFFGGQATFLDEVVEQFPSADVLQDQVQVQGLHVQIFMCWMKIFDKSTIYSSIRFPLLFLFKFLCIFTACWMAGYWIYKYSKER